MKRLLNCVNKCCAKEKYCEKSRPNKKGYFFSANLRKSLSVDTCVLIWRATLNVS